MVYTHLEVAPELSALTNIPLSVCQQWLRCEAQLIDNPSNPLNIRYPTRPYPGRPAQIGRRGGFGVYATQSDGVRDAAWLINNSGYYRGVRAAINGKYNSQAEREYAIAKAIENSPWAAGHYGHNCISSVFAQIPKPKPKTTPTKSKPKSSPKTSGPYVYVVKPGDTLWDISKKMYGAGWRWHDIYWANRHVIGSDPNLIRPGQRLVIPGK